MNVEQRVRERAYQIWIEAGRASGLEEQHWHEAMREVTASNVASPVAKPAAAKAASVKSPKKAPIAKAKVESKPVKTKPVASKTTRTGAAAASSPA